MRNCPEVNRRPAFGWSRLLAVGSFHDPAVLNAGWLHPHAASLGHRGVCHSDNTGPKNRLSYQGFTYTRRERVLDIGPIHATKDTQERVPLPPIAGGLALAAGASLLIVGGRTKS
jgi:hypothetical protein